MSFQWTFLQIARGVRAKMKHSQCSIRLWGSSWWQFIAGDLYFMEPIYCWKAQLTEALSFIKWTTDKGLILQRKCTTDHRQQWCEGWLLTSIYILCSLHTLDLVEQFITEHVIRIWHRMLSTANVRGAWQFGRGPTVWLCCIPYISVSLISIIIYWLYKVTLLDHAQFTLQLRVRAGHFLLHINTNHM
jgi:hypothetical protein